MIFMVSSLSLLILLRSFTGQSPVSYWQLDCFPGVNMHWTWSWKSSLSATILMSNSDTRCCAAGIPSVPGWPQDLDSAYTGEHPNFVQFFWRSFALDLIEGYGVPMDASSATGQTCSVQRVSPRRVELTTTELLISWHACEVTCYFPQHRVTGDVD